MKAFPWRWVFGGIVALTVINFFAGFLPGYAVAGMWLVALAIYFMGFFKKGVATRDIDWCDEKVKNWAIKERGIKIKEMHSFQEAVRLDGTEVFEIQYVGQGADMYRTEVNRRTGKVTRFVPTVVLGTEHFMSTDEKGRFRHIERPPRGILRRPPREMAPREIERPEEKKEQEPKKKHV